MLKNVALVTALICTAMWLSGCSRNEKHDKKTVEAIIAATEPAVVRIDVNTRDGRGVGSGFVIDDVGIVVTNYHVINGANSAKAVFADNSSAVVIGILGSDSKRDIAILRIQKEGKKLVPLKLLKGRPQKGQAVLAFGAPHGLSFSASEGIISGVRSAAELSEHGKPLEGEWIQTTAPISAGNSGGPLVDLFGRVVGINTFFLAKGQNLNFAVSASDIEEIYAATKTTTAIPLSVNADAVSKLYDKDAGSLRIPPKIKEWRSHEYRVVSEKGKFDTDRRIRLGPVKIDDSTSLSLLLIVKDDERVMDNASIEINSVASDWRFRGNRDLKFLVDGELINLGEMNRDTEVSNGRCIEYLNAVVPLMLLARISRANSSDVAVGAIEQSIGKGFKYALRESLSLIPLTKTASGIEIEVDTQMEAEVRQDKEVEERRNLEAERQLEERTRFQIVDVESANRSRRLFRVKLLSSSASQLSRGELNEVAQKVGSQPKFTVWFYLPDDQALSQKPWMILKVDR